MTTRRINEARWTPWGAGWTAPDGKSPEHAYTDLVAAWVALQRPRLVIETGAGGGTVTLRIAQALDLNNGTGALLAYESEPTWRKVAADRLAKARIPRHRARVTGAATPPLDVIERADLLVLDSITSRRIPELTAWAQHGAPGSYALVHDVSHRHAEADHGSGIHGQLATAVDELTAAHDLNELPTPNPRGGRILRRPGGHR